MNSWVVHLAKHLLESHKQSQSAKKTVKYQHSTAAPQALLKWEPFILGEVPFLLSLSRSGSCYTWTHIKKKKKKTEAVKRRHLPCIPLCLGNVTKYMRKGIGNDASELRHCSDPFHGESFACSSLPICKNST